MIKQTTLLEDEISPKEVKVPFWQIPKSVTEHPCLSAGAKLTYGIIFGSARQTGTAYPTYAYIKKHLGGVSNATLYRYIKELKNAKLIRSNQKGRGLSNNYYLLKSPLLGHDVYDNKVVVRTKGELPKLVDKEEVAGEFLDKVNDWFNNETGRFSESSFPVPHWEYDKKEYKEYKKRVVAKFINHKVFECGDTLFSFEI